LLGGWAMGQWVILWETGWILGMHPPAPPAGALMRRSKCALLRAE